MNENENRENLLPLNYWLFANTYEKNLAYFNFLMKMRKAKSRRKDPFLNSGFFHVSPDFVFKLLASGEPETRTLLKQYLYRHADDLIDWTVLQANCPHDRIRSRELIRLFIIAVQYLMSDYITRSRETLEALAEHVPEEFHDLINEQIKYLSIGKFARKKFGYQTKHIVKNLKEVLKSETYLKTSHP